MQRMGVQFRNISRFHCGILVGAGKLLLGVVRGEVGVDDLVGLVGGQHVSCWRRYPLGVSV